MNQLGVLFVLVIFVAAVSFVVASEQYKQGRMTTITLSGIGETQPGDPDGSGVLKFKVDASQNQFCYELTVANVDGPTAALIHSGTANQDGSSLITLQTPAGGSAKGCVTLDSVLIGDLRKNPSSYYLSIQSTEFPAGAIRGQLGR